MQQDVRPLRLEDMPGHLIRIAQQRHTQLWTAEFGPELTGPQYAVISAVANDDGLDQRTIGERASLDSSSVADLVARLHGQGWLLVTADPADGRRKRVRLTAAARLAAASITARAEAVQRQILRPLPPDNRPGLITTLRLIAYGGHVPDRVGSNAGVINMIDAVGHLIRRAEQMHTALWRARVGHGITPSQYAVLSSLMDDDAGMDKTTLALKASLDKSTTAGIVGRLVDRGWLTRSVDAEDARRQVLRLTPMARAELGVIAKAARQVQTELLKPAARSASSSRFLADCRTIAGLAPVDR